LEQGIAIIVQVFTGGKARMRQLAEHTAQQQNLKIAGWSIDLFCNQTNA
jgi:hypothetical protein